MNKEYELTEEQYQELLEASRPVPYILGSGGVAPRSPREKAYDFWRRLGKELGFKWKTVRPGKTEYHFFAETENA